MQNTAIICHVGQGLRNQKGVLVHDVVVVVVDHFLGSCSLKHLDVVGWRSVLLCLVNVQKRIVGRHGSVYQRNCFVGLFPCSKPVESMRFEAQPIRIGHSQWEIAVFVGLSSRRRVVPEASRTLKTRFIKN